MAERFKTGYLADRPSFSQLGREVGDDITSSIEKISAKRKQRQLELDSRMGFTKAQNESVPAGLSGRYMRGAQAALENMQEKAALAYSTGVPSDVQAYQQAKQEYNDLKNMGVSVSAREREIVDNISVGAFPNLTSTVPEALDEYQKHDQGQFKYEGGQLMFVDSDGSETPWRESRINDPRGGFLPQLKWEGSDFMVTPLSENIYTTNLAGKEGLYQIKFEGTDFQTGRMDDAKLYSDVQRILDKRLVANPNEMAEAMSLHGYKVNEIPNKAELSQQDVSAAGRIYPTEILSSNRQFLRGSFNAEGKFEFEMDMEEFSEAVPDEQRELMQNAREAKQAYYESVAGDLKERIQLDDEAGKYMAALDEEAKELLEAQLEAAADSAEVIGQAPSLIWDGEKQYTMVHSADSRYRMKLDGKPVNIDETYFEFVEGPDGEMVPIEVGFKTSATMSKQEMIQELLNAGEDQDAAQNVVDNWFNKYDNTIISRTMTDDDGNAHIEPNFMRIMTGLNNGIFTTGSKPGSQIHRSLAKRKMMLHRDGKLVEGTLTSNGIEQVQAEEPAVVTPAPSAGSGTTPTTTPAPAPASTTQATPAPAPAPVDSSATTAPEPEPEPANLDVPPSAEEIELDNAVARAEQALMNLRTPNGEANTITGIRARGNGPERIVAEIRNGKVPIFIRFSPGDYVSPEELEAMKGRLSDNLERTMITYLPIEELEGMTQGDFTKWRGQFLREEVERLKQATAPQQQAPEQPTEDAPTATAVSGDETDVANIEVPTGSVAAEEERQENERRETQVTLNGFYKALDELADFNEEGAERIQDYFEGLEENTQEGFMRMVIHHYSKEPRQYPMLIEGRLKFVSKPDSAD